MSTVFLKQLEQVAVEAALKASEFIWSRGGQLWAERSVIPFDTKSSSVDPVTEVDKGAEDFIRRHIISSRPDDGFIGEEHGYQESHSGVEWVIDPIDGTVNFLYGIPAFSVSIAAVVSGKVVAGAVADVAHHVVYHASEASGSKRTLATGDVFVNHPNQPPAVQQCLLGTGFGYAASLRSKQAEVLAQVLPKVRDIRRIGSAALDLCFVASGLLDIYYEHGLKSWDFAAGSIIAREAGVRVWHPEISTTGIVGNGSALVWAAVPQVAQQWQELVESVPIPAFLSD